MANLRTIQFLRNGQPYNSLESAKLALIEKAKTLLDGSPVVGRYTVQVGEGTEVRTILGIVANGTISFFNNTKEIDNVLENLDFGPVGGAASSVIDFIQETDGKISATTKNVGELTLSGYTKGSDSGTVVATDSINAAIAKLENQVDAEETARINKFLATSAATVADANKIVTDVTQSDGKITATAANITGVKLDGYAEAAAVADVASTDTLGQALGKLQKTIHEMDKAADAVAGQVVTTVSEADGVVSETKANVKDLQLGGYTKDTSATGAIASTDTINVALSKLENTVGANKISNADKSIVVTEPTGTATTTDIKVNIKSGDKVIKLGNDGIYTNLSLVKITKDLPATIKESYEFRDSDGNKIGESIDIAKDSHIVSITYDEATQNLIYKYLDASGDEQTVKIDMSKLILETEVENGIQSVQGKLSIKLDTTGDDTGDGKFLTVGANGLKLDGVTDAITAAIDALDVTDTAVAGQYVATVSETDGVVSVTRANVSDAVLTGYAKGTKPASTVIAATDDVKGAISKLEHQIDDAKAAATTKVVEGTDAGNNLTISSATSETDGSTTYTINLTDVASKTALDAEIAARKAVDGQNGDTYAANTSANFISAATSLNDADVKLDTALKAEETRAKNAEADLSGKTVTSFGSSNNSITITTGVTANGTVSADVISDASKLVLSGYTESTATSEQAISASDNVVTAIQKLYANVKHHHANGSKAINVDVANTGSTISLKLDETTTTSAANAQYVSETGNNVLQITNNGLYLDGVWDCGTFNDAPEP